MFRGERVLLRGFENGDEHPLYRWANDEDLQRLCRGDLILPRTYEDVFAFMRAQGGVSRGVYQYGCELFRKRMECAIMLQAALQADEEQQDGNADL